MKYTTHNKKVNGKFVLLLVATVLVLGGFFVAQQVAKAQEAKPDLTISEFFISPANPRVGEPVIVNVNVKNLGSPLKDGTGISNNYRFFQDMDLSNTPLPFSPNGDPTEVNPLDQGETIQIRLADGASFSSAGLKSVYYKVDNGNELAELDENNNTWSGSVVVGTADGLFTGDGTYELNQGERVKIDNGVIVKANALTSTSIGYKVQFDLYNKEGIYIKTTDPLTVSNKSYIFDEVGVIISLSSLGMTNSGDSIIMVTFKSTDVVPLVISELRITDVTSNLARFTWQTNKPANGFVYYRESGSNSSSWQGHDELKTSHSVMVSGLKQGTIYYYYILSKDERSDIARSSELSFTTQTQFDKPDLTITDVTLVPSNPQVGESVTVKVSVKNLGSPLTSGQGIDNWYASIQDLTWTSGGPALGPSRQVTAASPMLTGETILYTGSGKFTSTGIKSTYFRVDNSNELAELNEDNNSWSKSITIGNAVSTAQKPDLTAKNITYARIVSDQWDTQLEFDLVNIGQMGITSDFKLVVVNETMGTSLKEDMYSKNYFAPNDSSHVIIMGRIGENFADGENKIKIVVDFTNSVEESNESNNIIYKSVYASKSSGNITGGGHTVGGRTAKIQWRTDGRYNCSIVFKGRSDISDDLLFPGAGMSIAYAGEQTSLDIDLGALRLPNRESDKVVYYKIVCRDRADGHKVAESDVQKIKFTPAASATSRISSPGAVVQNDPEIASGEIRTLRERIKKLELRISELETQVVEKEKQLTRAIDKLLTRRVKGRILLQVDESGEAWYVDPITEERYYLKDGGTAYSALHAFGLGIKNSALAQIPIGLDDRIKDQDTDGDGLSDKLEEAVGTDPKNADSDADGYLDGKEVKDNYSPLGEGKMSVNQKLCKNLEGRILLQVEDKGQAWYVQNCRRYYMRDGNLAYQIMRFLSLGITNENLRKIAVGEFE